MKLGENLIFLRKTRGMSQTDLSKELKVTSAAISAIEKGRKFPSFRKFIQMADFFSVDLNKFVYDDLREEAANTSVHEPGSDTYLPAEEMRQLIRLSQQRIRQLEDVIAENMPDLADKLLIERKRKDTPGS